MIHQNNITDLIRYCVKINNKIIWIVVVVSKISVYIPAILYYDIVQVMYPRSYNVLFKEHKTVLFFS